jgi:protein-disulfide isomerase
MVKVLSLLTLIVGCAAVNAQTADVLATSSYRNFTVADLSSEARVQWEKRDATYVDSRRQFASQMASEILLELEAKARSTSAKTLLDREKAKVPDPTEAQIVSVYDANRASLGDRPLSEVRKRIVEFLRHEPEDAAVAKYIASLSTKYSLVFPNDAGRATQKPLDRLFSVGGRNVSVGEFEEKYRISLYDALANTIDDVRTDLESVILTALVAAEAAAEKTDVSSYIARNVTDKMRDFSDDERADLENALKRRLFAKYNVKFVISVPAPIVQNISVDDDPSQGPVSAPVTVVMFGDFQCSACARTAPMLKKAIAEFPGKVRFVARDFPLENIHENAFAAALAAGAANAQGKFFEYGDLLYAHQDALDGASLRRYAGQIGLNVKQFELDFTAEKTAAEVRKDMADGRSYGIGGTPTIFVNGVKVRRLSTEDFREAIETALATARADVDKPARRP